MLVDGETTGKYIKIFCVLVIWRQYLLLLFMFLIKTVVIIVLKSKHVIFRILWWWLFSNCWFWNFSVGRPNGMYSGHPYPFLISPWGVLLYVEQKNVRYVSRVCLYELSCGISVFLPIFSYMCMDLTSPCAWVWGGWCRTDKRGYRKGIE